VVELEFFLLDFLLLFLPGFLVFAGFSVAGGFVCGVVAGADCANIGMEATANAMAIRLFFMSSILRDCGRDLYSLDKL
jgi:hypothetical protein